MLQKVTLFGNREFTEVIEIIYFSVKSRTRLRDWTELIVQSLNHAQLFATPQTFPSVGFSRQESWCGLSFPPPGDLPNSRIKPTSRALQVDYLLLIHQESPIKITWGRKRTSPIQYVWCSHSKGKSDTGRCTWEDGHVTWQQGGVTHLQAGNTKVPETGEKLEEGHRQTSPPRSQKGQACLHPDHRHPASRTTRKYISVV